jgi:hypothetical protein
MRTRDPCPAPAAGRATLSAGVAANRNIFVAYPYSFAEADYRRPFTDLEADFGVKFVYADAEITSQHILDKITTMIRDSRFSLFDITGWNPNVTLELGIAIGHRQEYYLLFNPSHDRTDVPADLGGLDRIQYTSYTGLGDGLAKLLLQEFGVPKEGREMAEQLDALRERAPGIVAKDPGLKIGEIGDRLGVPIEMAQVIVRPLLADETFETTGQRKGTRYYLSGQAPKRGQKPG